MVEIHRVSPGFAVAAQLTATDVAMASREGYRIIVCNRPEGEEPGQPSQEEIAAEAARHGLAFIVLPFAGHPSPDAVAATATLLDGASEPILAYCRSGRRSIMAWAMAQALRGAMTPDELVAAGKTAGYDLAGAREALVALAQKP